MTQAAQKMLLSPSRDIPFNKLVLSQSNVRRIKAGVSVEDLAEDIARRTLLQSLNVRPVLDADGQEKTASARRCIRSTSSAPSRHCAMRARAKRRSPRASSSPRRSCVSA